MGWTWMFEREKCSERGRGRGRRPGKGLVRGRIRSAEHGTQKTAGTRETRSFCRQIGGSDVGR